MMEDFEMPSLEANQLVIVRKVDVAELPDELREQASDAGLEALYSIRTEEGTPIALVGDRDLAFSVALDNDLRPVSLH